MHHEGTSARCNTRQGRCGVKTKRPKREQYLFDRHAQVVNRLLENCVFQQQVVTQVLAPKEYTTAKMLLQSQLNRPSNPCATRSRTARSFHVCSAVVAPQGNHMFCCRQAVFLADRVTRALSW
jgi:hypothetical protein